jgi:hypothetical protein
VRLAADGYRPLAPAAPSRDRGLPDPGGTRAAGTAWCARRKMRVEQVTDVIPLTESLASNVDE